MILVKDIRANRANLIGNDFVSGLPSPFAFLGLVASMAPRFNAERWSGRVLPILHMVDTSEGRTKGEQAKDGKRFKTIEIPEDIRGTVNFSLLIDFGDDIYVDEGEMRQAVRESRLAGGNLFPARGADIKVETVYDGSALKSLPRGRALLPFAGGPLAKGYDDDLEKLAEAAFPEDPKDRKGWVVPSAVGYHLIEVPSFERKNVRDPSVPHAFAEPVAGLAELASHKSPRLSEVRPEPLRDIMWRYATAPGRVAAHPFYL